jgi:hypothetical protein
MKVDYRKVHCKIAGMLWMAPEHLRRDEYVRQGSQKGDVYSFSIILQEIVTRKSPYALGYTKPKGTVLSQSTVSLRQISDDGKVSAL